MLSHYYKKYVIQPIFNRCGTRLQKHFPVYNTSASSHSGECNVTDIISDDRQYVNLVKKVLQEGEIKEGRNGKTISYFGAQMRFSLKNNTIPLLTTKRVAWKTCLRELLWFIQGDTNNTTLQNKNVKIWNGNGTRKFLDSRGLQHLKENDLGPVYGHQWRHFNAQYETCDTDYSGKGIDQLKQIIDMLSGKHTTEDKYSRRLVISAWNPCQLNEMALPPCHVMFQFYVNQQDELSCSLYQRSGDIGLGVPFNIASYSFLVHLIAHHTGLKPGEFIHTIGDCHIYDDHIDVLKEQINRESYSFPTIQILRKCENIDDYVEHDFHIENYKYHTKLNMNMRV
jgi:thymidylate synthase